MDSPPKFRTKLTPFSRCCLLCAAFILLPLGCSPQVSQTSTQTIGTQISSNLRPKQAQSQSPRRYHTTIQANGQPKLVTATVPPISRNQVTIAIKGDWRILKTQNFQVPAQPRLAERITRGGWIFGVAVNGIVFDPGNAEVYKGNPRLGWRYDALSGAIALGFDANHTQVQPNGTYHYHGIPKLLLKELNVNHQQHSPLIGWAADGFPIYAFYGYQDVKSMRSTIIKMTSSYQLRSGQRPGGDLAPGGTYDGTFEQDYEYVFGKGTLDECNGRLTVTKEFPQGTYAYFITEQFPIVPRCFRGTPSPQFRKGPPPDGRRPGSAPPRNI